MERILTPQDLAEENIRLVGAIVKKFPGLAELYGYDELFSVGCMGLVKASFSYNKDFISSNGHPVKFSTYAGKCITNEILLYHRSSRRYVEHNMSTDIGCTNEDGEDISLHEIAVEDFSDGVVSAMADTELIDRVRQVLSKIKDFERMVFLSWLSGKSMSLIAEEEHFSKGYISRVVGKVKLRLFRTCLGGGGINVQQQSVRPGTSDSSPESSDDS